MLILLFFIFGLIIGSFLNVLIYRLRDAETLLGRSFCRHCKHQVRFFDNIPLVSFILLRGQCRDCKKRISWQYPVVELLTGLLFALVGYLFFLPAVSDILLLDLRSWLEILWLLSIVSAFLVIAAYDLQHMEIPLSLLVVSALVTYLFFIAEFLLSPGSFFDSRLGEGLAGGLAVGGFFFALVYASRETWMGWGDVWLGFVSGSIVGLALALPMLTLSFGTGAIFGLWEIATRKKGMQSQIPFAPFLVFGTLAALFLSEGFPEYFRFFIL